MRAAELRRLSERRRRTRNNRELGRTTRHWRRLSELAREQAAGVCASCGRAENTEDPGSKLTVDLLGGGDHSRAKLEDTVVLCRRCHGRRDGGRPPRQGGRGVLETEGLPDNPPRVGISLPAALKARLRPRSSRHW